jgi:hypothetical protein
MRRIMSQADLDAKRKRNTLIISLFMLGILVFGTVGYAVSLTSKEDSSSGNGITNLGDRWEVPYQGQNFYLSNSPDDVKNISVSIESTLSTYSSSPVYIVSGNNAVGTEITSVLSSFSPRIQKACYGSCEENLPEKDCTENLIIWRDSLENKVYQEENCVFIDGDLKAVDAFLYKLLGLI